MATAKIQSGMAHCIAGGAESMSFIPMEGYKPIIMLLQSRKRRLLLGMGLMKQKRATFKVSREDQDEFAYNSHLKALKAQEGKFDKQIVPITVEHFQRNGKKETKSYVVNKDDQAGTSKEALAGLRPVFEAGGSVTAGNSSQMSDGAFFVHDDEEMVEELEPIARLVNFASAGVEPRIMGIGP
jgi:acetyl-CoA acyltransferase